MFQHHRTARSEIRTPDLVILLWQSFQIVYAIWDVYVGQKCKAASRLHELLLKLQIWSFADIHADTPFLSIVCAHTQTSFIKFLTS